MTPLFSDRILACLKAPGQSDDSGIEFYEQGLRSTKSGIVYPFITGVPSLVEPTQYPTTQISSFPEENSLPSYEGLEEFGELVSKGSRNPFSAQLLKAIGYNKTVLDCGCGTGQLSQYLQLNNNHVLGIDMSLKSLSLAIEHKMRNSLTRSSFCQMNIFDLAIKDNSFDVVIAHGVLNHTGDAHRAFGQIVRKVKPGGVLVVGLNTSSARVVTWLRSKLLPGREANIASLMNHSHATGHTIGEVIKWFDKCGITYLNCSPAILGSDGEDAPGLFTATNPGNVYQRMLTQLGWIGSLAHEEALFNVIGLKKG